MITKERKAELTKKFGKTPTDSGSPEVQVAILTERIKNLTDHFGNHKQDHHSKRGMMKMIGQRRRMLKFIKAQDNQRYTNLIQELGLRR